jgi:SAM-dependent methyltransferase
MDNVVKYYDQNYFNLYQKKIGLFGGKASLFKFQKFIKKSDTVLDFGCGGGFLLSNLTCKKKLGIEINETARINAIKLGIDCFDNIDLIEDSSVDVVISSHCLEHTTSPHDVIIKIYNKLKSGGTIIIVVPIDSFRVKYKPNNVDNHLYSFSPMNLGNLLNSVGFKDIQVKPLLHKWPPYYFYVQKYLGWKLFHAICYLYGHIRTSVVQIKVVAQKI